MNIRNKTFTVGQTFRGVVNGAIFKVVKVEESKGPHNKQAGVYVTFEDERGQRDIFNLKTAQRLLLDPIATDGGSTQKVLPACKKVSGANEPVF